MRTARTFDAIDRGEIIQAAIALAMPTWRCHRQDRLKRSWVVRWDGRCREVYKNTARDEYGGGFGYLEHDQVLELYTAAVNGESYSFAWGGEVAADRCEGENELRALVTERIVNADDRYFASKERQETQCPTNANGCCHEE